jgi:hypothetical protein
MIGICVTMIGLVKIVEERIAGARILALEAFRHDGQNQSVIWDFKEGGFFGAGLLIFF